MPDTMLTGGNNPCGWCGRTGLHHCELDPRNKLTVTDTFTAAALTGLLLAGFKGDLATEALKLGTQVAVKRWEAVSPPIKKV